MHKRIIFIAIFLVLVSCNIPSTLRTESQQLPGATLVPQPLTSALLSQQPGCTDNEEQGAIANVVNGKLLVDGTLFFPLGMYHVSWAGTKAERADALTKIADAGFNLIHPSVDSQDGNFLQQVQDLNMRVIVEFNQDPQLVIRTHRNQQSIIGWNIADDVDNGNYEPEDIITINNNTKNEDPTRLTYISGSNKDRLRDFQSTADIIAIQAYPIGNGNLKLDYVADVIGTMRATIDDRPLIANLQTFAWPGERPPSGNEVRNMTYQALIMGVDGIIYYTFFDSVWLITDEPELWSGLENIVGEVNLLIPVLLSDTRQQVPTGNDQVLASTWTYNSQLYLIVVNTSENRSQSIQLTIPAVITGEVRELFQSEPSDLSLEGTTLQGSIEAAQAHVFELPLTPVAADPSDPRSSIICPKPEARYQIFMPMVGLPGL